tara:strand:- start:289 stop:732 length:444 start_codon:yes stop_codon:yes gene_type:complete
VALIAGEHLITFNLIKAMKSGFSYSLLTLGLLSILMLPLAGLSESTDLEKGITQRNLASSEARKGNYEEALKLLHQASENGDHIASWKLAGNYRGTLQGWDVKKDLRKARYYEKLAAEQGNPGAQRLINAITPWWKFWAFYGWWRFW